MRDTSQLPRDAVIVEAVRTPVSRAHGENSIFRDVHPTDLLGQVFVALVDRTRIDAVEVDNAIAGCVYQIGEQSMGVTRNAWLEKGLPASTGATTVDVRCGSGQQAVNYGALLIATGTNDLVIAGGVEHMGRVGFSVNREAQELWGQGQSPALLARYPISSQGVAAELIADRWNVTRTEMDELALRSHQLADRATVDGMFAREIVGVPIGCGFATEDQGIRRDTTIEALAALPPAFRKGGRVTAGNSSQISTGAAAVLLASESKARALGLPPRARIRDQVVLGVDPVTMLTGPIDATSRILERNGLSIGDLDVVQVNEAFASVVAAYMREHRADRERVNPRGGAIALGHPLGATGARLITTLVHELEDLDGELGLVTMCCGGGVGTATLIERI